MGDMKGNVINSEGAQVVGMWGARGVNENSEHLAGICTERGLFLANTLQHKINFLCQHTWRLGKYHTS